VVACARTHASSLRPKQLAKLVGPKGPQVKNKIKYLALANVKNRRKGCHPNRRSFRNQRCLHNAAEAWARAQFEGSNEYVFALHTDTPRPHVHIAVKARGYDGKAFNPTRGRLQDMRIGFASELRARGIDADATFASPRIARTQPFRDRLIAHSYTLNLPRCFSFMAFDGALSPKYRYCRLSADLLMAEME